MTQNIQATVQSSPRDYKHGVCAQDFETTLHAYMNPTHLRGLLNFSALWNQVTYIYDTAIADSPHLLGSYFSESGSTGRDLYSSITEFIRAGAVKCLFRDKIQIKGRDVSFLPNTTDLYAGWLARDEGRTDKFMCQIFGTMRAQYNREIDRVLDSHPSATTKRYRPDDSKREFRKLVINDSGIRNLVQRLPVELQNAYERVLNENKYFTTVDLWTVVKDHAESDKAALELMQMHGYLNQQAFAVSVDSGISGSDYNHPWRPRMFKDRENDLANEHNLTPTNYHELLERSSFSMSAPGLELISLLSPDEILMFREKATKKGSIFSLEIPADAAEDEIKRQVSNTIKDYWSTVCDYLYYRYPDHTRERTKIAAFADSQLAGLKNIVQKQSNIILRESPWLREICPILIEVGIKRANPLPELFSAEGIMGGLKKMGFWLIYQRNDAMREVQNMRYEFWKPKAAWVSSTDVKLLGDS